MNNWLDKLSRHKIFLAILSIGIALRIWNIGWALPEVYEEATPFLVSWNFWNWDHAGLSFHPHFFNYPAFTFYFQFAVQAIHYCFGLMTGQFHSLVEFKQAYQQDPSSFIILARLATEIFDFGSIILVYLFCKRIFNNRVALMASLFMALNPLLIKHTHLINVDTPLTFFTLLALYGIYKIYQEGTFKFYLVAGIAIGLAAASKYTGAFLLPVLALGHLLRFRKLGESLQPSHLKMILLSGLCAIVVFFLFNPYILLDFAQFKENFTTEQEHMELGHLGIDAGSTTIGYYLLDALPQSIGLFLIVATLTGMILLLKNRKKEGILILAFPVLYLFVISTWTMRVERYLLPIIPLFLIASVYAMSEIIDRVEKKKGTSSGENKIQSTGMIVALCFISLLQPVTETFRYETSITLPDTRHIAKQWIESNLPAGSAIATGPFGISIPDTYNQLQIPFLVVEPERMTPFYQPQWYENFDLLIASDYDYSRYAKEPERFKEILQYYSTLQKEWKLALEVKPTNYQTGPTIWLYQPQGKKDSVFDLALFRKLESVPESARTSGFLRSLSYILITKEELGKAEQVLRSRVAGETGNLDARRSLTGVLFQRGNYMEALTNADYYLRYNPRDTEMIVLREDAFLKVMNSSSDMEANLIETMNSDPNKEGPYLELIRLYSYRSDTKKLIPLLKRYISIAPAGSKRREAAIARLNQLQEQSK